MISARLARPDELGAAIAITDRAYAPWVPILGGKPVPMTDDYAARIERGEAWMVERGGAVVGLMVLEQQPDHLLIASLAVLPEAQGGGIGRWMLAYADALAATVGVSEVRLYTNTTMTQNIDLYHRCGFQDAGVYPNPKRPDWQVQWMTKTVNRCAATPRAGRT